MNNRVGLAPYVPTIAARWDDVSSGSRWLSIDGSLVFVDISGFTALSERLAERGRIGAEELTTVLNRIFGEMLEVASRRGGTLLKFGGDALLLLFEGPDHPIQACAAAVEMRSTLRLASQIPTSVGRIPLKMSTGIHTGSIDFFLVGDSHRELLVTGPAATVTTAMESTAEANEILVSQATRDLLPSGFAEVTKGDGWLLKKRRINHPVAIVPDSPAVTEDLLAGLVPKGLRTHLSSDFDDAEHRLATIGFLQFSGVSGLAGHGDNQTLAQVLHELICAVQEEADREGVTFLATDIDADGGKVILTSGVPSSQHDDEGSLLRTLRAVLDRVTDLDLRAGANRGHVFAGSVGGSARRTFTIMGDAVNLAARLMASAPPGRLYASPGVLERSSTLFRVEALGDLRVKGKSEVVRAYDVAEDLGVRPPDEQHLLPFHGREAELEMLVSIVTTCARLGRGGMMTVSGPTGVGKSRLIAEVIERCPGLATLTIQAEPNGRDNPYWAFRDPLRALLGIERSEQGAMAAKLETVVTTIAPALTPLLPLLGDVLHIEMSETPETSAIDPRFRRERTGDAVVELLAALQDRPFAVIAEDGQWLDDASRGLLQHIGDSAERRPWTVIATFRDDGSPISPLGDEIKVARMEDAAIRVIAIEATAATPLRPHELSAVVERADGNPLFLGEILKVVTRVDSPDELPESLDAVISREIDTLSPRARQILRYVSVLGRSFRRVVLTEYLSHESLALEDDLEDELSQFLEADGRSKIQFRHAVVHDIAYQGLPYRRRQELHARAGMVIETLAGDDLESVAEFLALHYSRSGERERTWRYAQVAAEKARRTYANTEAAIQYERALEAGRHLEVARPAVLADLWTELGEVQELAGQMEASREAYSKALTADAHNAMRTADICLRRAGTWMSSGNLSQAKRFVSLGQKAIQPARSRDEKRLLARLVAFEASIFMLKSDPMRAADSARRGSALGRSYGEEEALARAYAVLDWANFMLGDDAERHGPEAIAIYQRLGLLERSVGVMNNMGAFAYLEGRWGEAIEWYEQSLSSAERSGNVLEAALTRANIAEVLIGQGRHAEAAPLLAEARRTYEASKSDYYLPLVGLLEARASIGAGDVDGAKAQLEVLLSEDGRADPSPWGEETGVAYAEALARCGLADMALDQLETAGEDPDRVAPGVFRVRSIALATLDLRDESLEALQLALAAAETQQNHLEEALAREEMEIVWRRAGTKPDPASTTRLAELRDQLGLVALQLA